MIVPCDRQILVSMLRMSLVERLQMFYVHEGKKHFNINRKHLSMFSLTSCNLKLKIAAYNQTAVS